MSGGTPPMRLVMHRPLVASGATVTLLSASLVATMLTAAPSVASVDRTTSVDAPPAPAVAESTPADPVRVQLPEPPQTESEPVELPIMESWTPTSHSVTTGDETTTDLFARPAFVREADGWRAVDDMITPGTDYPFEATGLVNPVRFGTTADELVGIETTDGTIWFGIDGASVQPPTLDEGIVTYADIFPGVDLELSTTGGRLGKHLVLEGPQAPHSFRFTLQDADHILGDPTEGEDESWTFEGAVAFGTGLELPAPAAWSDGAELGLPGSAHQDVAVTESGYDVALSVDELWAEGAHYPLVLDPAVEWTSETWYDDDGLAVAFAPTGSDACDGEPCTLADPVDGQVTIGNPDWDDPDIGYALTYVGADLGALADRQVVSAVLGGYEDRKSVV